MEGPRPHLQNPIMGTTIDTSPKALGLVLDARDEEDSPGVVDRIIRKSSQIKKSGHRKLNSISRKAKGPPANDEHPEERVDELEKTRRESKVSLDDAGSSYPPSRPSLNFRGEGSLRMGTQTLIQALQAIPWAEAEGGVPDKDDSDENDADKPGVWPSTCLHVVHAIPVQTGKLILFVAFTLSSSIHTIHRPVARFRRQSTAVDTASPENDSPDEEDEDDFDPDALPLGASAPRPPLHTNATARQSELPTRTIMRRSTSLATVKVQRRARLAEKLKEVFDVPEIGEVIAEMPCWLLRSVLLQGYMYLTNSHICFFAHMPSRENQVLKSGSLSKKAQRTKRWNKHWFVLKNDALTWFHSSADPYFPHGVVDLRYAIACEPHGEKGLRIRTNQRTVNLDADSIPSRDEWVKAIRKVIFQAQNHGDSVKIAIPYSAVVNVTKSKAMDFSETIEIKVVDKEDDCLDSYFFAYFHSIDLAVEQIRAALKEAKESPMIKLVQDTVKDTTSHKTSTALPLVHELDKVVSAPTPSSTSSTLSSVRDSVRDKLSTPVGKLNSLLRPGHTTPDSRPTSTMSTESSPITVTASPKSAAEKMPGDHTYPPSLVHHNVSDSSTKSSWSVPVGVPNWIKNSSKHFFTSSPEVGPGTVKVDTKDVGGIHTSAHQSTGDHGDFGFSIVDGLDSALDPATVDKFRAAFAFDERETLLAEIPGYLFRVLPVFGRVNISSNYFCFRSSQPLTKTRMMIPIRDILSTENAKAFRFGHHGLAVVIKGHEELFFEFSSIERRNACAALLDKLVDELRERQRSGLPTRPALERPESLLLETTERRSSVDTDDDTEPKPPPEGSDNIPAVMFTSVGSTFLTFKPQESLRFTCLTIGSRGDVQPYIALAKGLQADGHKVKIATHLEFKDWVEGHGIEYGYVGGDPAELMRICVENGTFTVAFLREGLAKFRGWLDDLLKTSWEACQGSDVLIESPSAMGGIHIAEALQIPYYRAFTMPWTRTRAYPHAFAVPDTKMGGSYNYLTYVMFDQVFWRAISGQINRWRKQLLGIPATTMDKQEAHKVPFLYNFSPTVVPPPLDWYEWIRVTGYWFLDDSENSLEKKWEPPAGLVDFMEKARSQKKKLVYIGFGSIVVSDPDAMTKCVIEAVRESGVYAIMSKGWSDRLSSKKHDTHAAEAVPPLPEQIYNITSVPHDWLFRQIDAACHHGGAGTTGASLRAGIPTIIKPFFGDQYFWADRVEALGIGTGVRKLTVENLTAALITATTDVKQIARADAVGKAIRSENGVANAVESIYRDLEYARSIIKRYSHETPLQEETDTEWEVPHKPGGEGSTRALSDDWNMVDEAHPENSKEAGTLSPLKRMSMGLSALTLHPKTTNIST
ncbi:Sterol 3-beta-glucosyltransferase; AltName: Full=Autophagy-related protein 26 [Serendipita indica DSM 11827]|nr:Sterol 3-beta-glucosyltransferase; AltName: Full=Autophagy-related protein 26 [Serendipita indica DSM 11827]